MDDNTTREIYRLVRENNQMLHSMRRNAFFWGFVKFIVYAILFAAPIWFYMTYVSGTVDHLMNTVDKIQGTNNGVQAKFGGFSDVFKKLQEQFGGATTSTTTQE